MQEATARAGISRRWLWIVPTLIIVVCGLILGVFYFNQSLIRQVVFRSLIYDKSEEVKLSLRGLFDPIAANLRVTQEWGKEGSLDLHDIPAINRRLIPVLQQLPQIAGVSIADGRGRDYLLIRAGDEWLTRVTEPQADGRRAGWARWSDAVTVVQEWTESTDFDARARPWYTGAQATDDPARLFWSKPYVFESVEKPGMTVSLRWQGADLDKNPHVVAFDVLLFDISAHTGSLGLSEGGKAFVFTPGGRVIGLPNDPRYEDPEIKERALLSPVDELGLPSLAAAYRIWREPDGDPGTAFPFTAADTHWWAGFRFLPFDELDLWLGLVVPEEELFQSLGAPRDTFPIAVVAIGAVAFIASLLLVSRHNRQLDALAARGGLLDENGLRDIETPDGVLALIRRGESEGLEFKSTIRWNLKANRPGKEIELAWLKSVVGFLNADGGTILLGVDDTGAIVGLDPDNFPNEDKCLRHIDNLIDQHVGSEFSRSIRVGVVPVDEKQIAVIRCSPARAPAFLHASNEEEFYVRSGPGSRKLPPSQILKYLDERRGHRS